MPRLAIDAMTGRTANRVLRPKDFLDIHPDDARRLGVVDGKKVALLERIRLDVMGS